MKNYVAIALALIASLGQPILACQDEIFTGSSTHDRIFSYSGADGVVTSIVGLCGNTLTHVSFANDLGPLPEQFSPVFSVILLDESVKIDGLIRDLKIVQKSDPAAQIARVEIFCSTARRPLPLLKLTIEYPGRPSSKIWFDPVNDKILPQEIGK
jgi:hypothetical protein